jgi:hypothetical protein
MNSLSRFVLTTAISLLAASSVTAQTHEWAVPGSGNWNVPINWSGGTVPNSAAHWASIAYDSGIPYTVDMNISLTLDRLDLIGDNAILFVPGRSVTVLTNAGIGVPLGASNTQILRMASSNFQGGGQLTNSATVESWGASNIEGLYNDGLLVLQGQPAYGNSSLTLQAPAYSEGTIDLTSITGGYAATLRTSTGTQLENLGTINFLTGSGGARNFNGSLLNRGTVNIGQPTGFAVGPIVQDQNKIHIQGVNSLTVGNNVTFQLDGGALEVDGSMLQTNGTFDWNGGTILNNAPTLANIALELDFNSAESGSLRLVGTSTVDGILRSGQILYLTGNSSYGNSTNTWQGTGDLIQQGQIWMLSEVGGYGATLAAPSGARFVNQGSLATQVGTGGARTINGSFLNDTTGSINFSTTTKMNTGPIENQGSWAVIDGALMDLGNSVAFTQGAGVLDVSDGSFFHPNGDAFLLGGNFVGDPVFANNDLTLGPGFTSAFTGRVIGTSTLTGDLGSGQLLRIHGTPTYGNATLTLQQATQLAGEMYLASETGGYSATLQDAGNGLTNTGLLQFDPGQGGARTLRAVFVNQGTVQVNQPLSLSTGSYVNQAAWNVASGASVLVGNSLSFTQEDGTLTIDGTWEHPNGSANFVGGTVLGEPLFSSTDLLMDPAFTSPFTGRTRGTNSLTGDIKLGQKMTLQGDAAYGVATMNLSGGNLNAGEIELMTSNSGTTVRLGTTNAVFNNSGTVLTSVGVGGARFLRGDISNAGLLDIDANTTMEDGPVLNSGTIDIAASTLLNLNNSMSFEQSDGLLRVDGAFEQQNGTMRLLGGSVTGIPLLSNIQLELGSGFTNAFEANLRGTSTLTGDLASGQKLNVLGDATYGVATLNLAGATQLAGEVELLTSNSGTTVRLGTTDVDMLNTGTIQVSEGVGGARFLRGNITNEGLIQVDQPAILEDGPIINSGDINVASGESLNFNNSMIFEQNAGTIQIDGSMEVPNSTSTLNGGNISGVPLFSSGSLTLGSGFTSALEVNLRGTVTFNGDIEVNQLIRTRSDATYGASNLSLPAQITNRGEIELTNFQGGYNTTITAALGNEPLNEGTIRALPGLGGTRFLTMQLENDGLLDLQSVSQLGRSGAVHSNRGTLRATAPLTLVGTSFTNLNGARVESNSTITNSTFTIQNEGTWDVGPGIGTGNVSGHWTQSADGRMVIEIGGYAPGTEHDQLVIAGVATLDGRVRIQTANGFQPKFGDQFTILTASSTQTLGFEGISFDGDLPLGYGFELVDTGNSIIAQVVQTVKGIAPGEAPVSLSEPSPGIAGQLNTFQVSGATGNGQVVIVFGLATGSTPSGACSGVDFGIDAAAQVGSAFASAQGNALVSAQVPAGASGITAYFQALDLERCELSPVNSFLFP